MYQTLCQKSHKVRRRVYFESDATVMNQDMSQVVERSGEWTVVGGRIDGDRYDGGGRWCIGLCVKRATKCAAELSLIQTQQ